MMPLSRVEKILLRNQLVMMKVLNQLYLEEKSAPVSFRLMQHIGYTHQFLKDNDDGQ